MNSHFNWFFEGQTDVQDVHSCWLSSYLKWAKCKVLLARVSGGLVEHICDFTAALQAVTLLPVNLFTPRRQHVLVCLIGWEMKERLSPGTRHFKVTATTPNTIHTHTNTHAHARAHTCTNAHLPNWTQSSKEQHQWGQCANTAHYSMECETRSSSNGQHSFHSTQRAISSVK